MDQSDDFTPVIGRIGRGDPAARPYLSQVVRTARRAGEGSSRRGRRFDGSRIGRGAGLARLLGGRDRLAGLRSRRAIVKTRLVRLRAGGGAKAHLRYLQRDGVQRDGAPGLLYSDRDEAVDGGAFLERCDGDRHQFRIIVSPEDSDQYDDLKPLTRRFMAQMEQDLGTKLDWVAVDHVDTGQPHTHIMLRGRDDRDQNLIIAREYISRGMRERVADLVTTDLGPRLDRDIRQRLRLEVSAERLTSIDRALVRRLKPGRFVAPSSREPFRHALEAGRLQKLQALGLAWPYPSGQWQLADDFEGRLRRLGERGDIIRTMQRALTAERLERNAADRIVHDGPLDAPIIGRLVARGLADELADRHYALVDGTDGRLHHVVLSPTAAAGMVPTGAIVRAAPEQPASSIAGTGRQPANANSLEILSPVPLERLSGAPGLTWLDRRLLSEPGEPIRDAGFGRNLRSALALRRQWLLDHGLASEEAGQLRGVPGVAETLRKRDLVAAGDRLSKELGRSFALPVSGERISGIVERRVDLPSGAYALVANSQEFTLVPWRPLLERRLGTYLSGIIRDHDVSWQLGRGRSGPSIA